MKIVAAFVTHEPPAAGVDLCDEARFLLRLVAAHHGFGETDMLNRLVALEAQSIGIGNLATDIPVKRDLKLVSSGKVSAPPLSGALPDRKRQAADRTLAGGGLAGGERETRAARIYDEGDTRC